MNKELAEASPPLEQPSQETGESVLCYVDGAFAYFTTNKLSEQWGDDWNDAPYEHNAEPPYEYSEHDKKEGRKPFRITKIAWSGDFEAPCEHHTNSPWSVEDINSGKVAWLSTSRYRSDVKQFGIMAGTTLERFCELIELGGGTVYLPRGLSACRKNTNGGKRKP